MNKLTIEDLARIYGIPFRAFDMNGREVHHVRWVDPGEGTFGQLVVDEDNRPQKDPDDPKQVWEIVRYGRLRLEPMKS